jgi:hypothetical protein
MSMWLILNFLPVSIVRKYLMKDINTGPACILLSAGCSGCRAIFCRVKSHRHIVNPVKDG